MEIEVTPDGPSSYVGACLLPTLLYSLYPPRGVCRCLSVPRLTTHPPTTRRAVRGSLPAVPETYSLNVPAESAQELIGGDAGLPDLPLERRREVVEGIAERVQVVRRAGKNKLVASATDDGLLL